MDIQELLRMYGSQSKIAEAFQVSRQAVAKWFKDGKLPPMRQWQAQVLFDMQRLKR